MIPKCIKLLQFCKTFKFCTLLNQDFSKKMKSREGKYGKTSHEGFQAGNMAHGVPFLQVFYIWKFVITEPGRRSDKTAAAQNEGGELKGHCLPSCTKSGL